MPNINDYFANTGVGTGANRTKILSDGSLKHEGSASAWDDIVGALIGKSLTSTSGKVDYSWEENSIIFQSGGNISSISDCVVFSLQYPHGAKIDGSMNMHIHWEQTDAVARTFTVKHRVQKNGQSKNTAWVTTVVSTTENNVFPYTSGTLNQTTNLVSVDMTGSGMSATVQFQLTRTDIVAGDILSGFIDAHVEYDSDGSNEEFVK